METQHDDGRQAAGSRQQAAANVVQDAERSCDELRDALESAGVRLPLLEPDTASCATLAPFALIDPGRRDVATARALTTSLRPNLGERQGAAR